MNKSGRAQLDKAHKMIDEAKTIIEEVAKEEKSEDRQAAERGQRMEEIANHLSDVASRLWYYVHFSPVSDRLITHDIIRRATFVKSPS